MCYYHLGSSLHFLGKEWVRGDDNPILEFRQLIMDCHSSSWIIMDQQQQQQHHHHHHHHLHHKYYQLDIISIYHCCHRCHRCQNNYGGWKMKELTGNQQVKPHQRYSRNGRYLCIWRVAQQLQSEGLKQPDPRNYNDALPASHWYPADLTLTPQLPPRRALRGLADLHTKLSTRDITAKLCCWNPLSFRTLIWWRLASGGPFCTGANCQMMVQWYTDIQW